MKTVNRKDIYSKLDELTELISQESTYSAHHDWLLIGTTTESQASSNEMQWVKHVKCLLDRWLEQGHKLK